MRMIIEGDEDPIENIHKLSFSNLSSNSKANRSQTPRSDISKNLHQDFLNNDI